jgi:hypothetical protein
MIEAGKYYTRSHGQDMVDRHELMLDLMVKNGAEQSPPVTIVPMPAGERQKWVDMLPDLAGEWAASVDAQGGQGTAFLAEYMNALREAGEVPARDWDK